MQFRQHIWLHHFAILCQSNAPPSVCPSIYLQICATHTLYNRYYIHIYSIYIYVCVYLFPTCQVRVVRFYQSALPPPPLPPPRPPPLAVLFLLVLLQFLLDHVCINFHLHFRLANSSPSSLPTLFTDSLRQALCQLPSSVCTAGPQPGTFPAQRALLDLNLGPSQLSVHCWTSTWDLPSSVCSAGPQPGTFPAQCALLDLNLGPAQLSVHRWTSTWDLPSSVCTAGPQRPDRMPENMPEEKICQIECKII